MSMTVIRGAMSAFQAETTMINPGLFFRSPAEVEKDRNVQGGLAVAAALMGESGTASASRTFSGAEVPASIVRFEIDGKTFHGMFESGATDFLCEGDEVAVVVDTRPDGKSHHARAIARPADRLIAMPPHGGRGRKVYFRRAMRRCLMIAAIAAAITAWVLLGGDRPSFNEGLIGCGIALGVVLLYMFIEYRIYVENCKPIVHLTEKILSALGLDDVESIDLIEHSKKTRTGNELPNYRWSFYRY